MKRIVYLVVLLFLLTLFVGYIFNDTGHFFNIKKSQDQIRIATWNVSNFGWDNGYSEIRRDRILNTLNEIDADFICLQEAVLSYDTSLINNVDLVSKTLKLPYYRYAYLSIHKFDNQHHFGDIILSKYPIIHTDTFITNDGSKKYVTIKSIVKGDTIAITNVHLQSNAIDNRDIKKLNFISMYQNYNQNKLIRKEHLEQLLHFIGSKPKSIILGDFNDTPLSAVYDMVRKDFSDVIEMCGKGKSITFKKSFLKLRIDYIFYGGGIICYNAGVLDSNDSDHRPLIMDFNFY